MGSCAPGSALQLAARARRAGGGRHAASALYLRAGLLFRYAWVEAGQASARDDRAVAEMHRAETGHRRGPGAPPGARSRTRSATPASPITTSTATAITASGERRLPSEPPSAV